VADAVRHRLSEDRIDIAASALKELRKIPRAELERVLFTVQFAFLG